MPSLPALLARGAHLAGAISPALGGRMALRLFFTTSPRMEVRAEDRETHLAAQAGRIRVHGADVVTYRWGEGERTVLLLHGWQGRAAQFAPLVRDLVADGFRVVSFDAPAHGSSGGRRTDVRDWVAAAERLQEEHGPFHALVGHSFGALAALTAARSTVPTGAVAVIAGASSPVAFIEEFSRQLRLAPAVAARMRQRFLVRLDLDDQSLIARFDAAAHPLPPETALLVAHDRTDRRMPDADALRLHAAHGDRSRLLRTDGLGHNRVLRADPVLDAVGALVSGGLPAVDALGSGAFALRSAEDAVTGGRTE